MCYVWNTCSLCVEYCGMCGLYDVGRCVCYQCCMCHVCVVCDVHVVNGSGMCGMNLLCYTSGFDVRCVQCVLLCVICMMCGVCLHCMGGVCCSSDVSVLEVLHIFCVLSVCVYYEGCVCHSCVFMVYV